jgi:hypothetical protein
LGRPETEETRLGDGSSARGVDLVPIAKPTLIDAETWVPTPSHLSLTPEQHLSMYSDRQWEEFVLEWATTLQYEQVMRSGGAYDHGVDVAAFVTGARFEGVGQLPM